MANVYTFRFYDTVVFSTPRKLINWVKNTSDCWMVDLPGQNDVMFNEVSTVKLITLINQEEFVTLHDGHGCCDHAHIQKCEVN